MIPKIEIEYNPFYQAASLKINEKVYDRPGSKLNSSLVGKPMCDWLQPQRNSYHQWDGFLAELMNEINTEHFDLTFIGVADDYASFCAEISSQTNYVKELGFCPGRYGCSFREKYSSEQIISQVRILRDRCPSSLPTQELYIMRDAINDVLNQPEQLSIDATRELVEDFRKFVSRLCHELKQTSKGQYQKLKEMLHQLDDLY